MTYRTSNYEERGGARTVIGGELDIVAGGALKVGGTDVGIGNADRVPVVAKVALGVDTGDAGVFAWQNPETSAILVTRCVLDITTPATGTPSIDVGSNGDGTGSGDDLIDGQTIGDAAKLLDNFDDQGTNGQATIRLDENGGTTDWITGTATADPAGLVGNAYITYTVV